MTRWLVSPFFNETEVMEIKFGELGEWADVIVIVEGNRTFAGEERECIFPDEMDRFAGLANEIRYVPIDMPVFRDAFEKRDAYSDFRMVDNGAWAREHHLRDAPLTVMPDLAADDIVLISDADEIVKLDVLEAAEFDMLLNDPLLHNRVIRFNLPQHVMWLNWRWDWEPQSVARLASGATIQKYGIEWTTRGLNPQAVEWPGENLGWHFAYMGGRERIIHKIRSAAHIELVRFATNDNVGRCMTTGEDLFGRVDCRCHSVDVRDLPSYVVENLSLFESMIGPELRQEAV